VKVYFVQEVTENNEIICPVCQTIHSKKGDKIHSFASELMKDGRIQMYSVCHVCNQAIAYVVEVSMWNGNKRFPLEGVGKDISDDECQQPTT
jgi:hypothetical protein